MSSDSPSRRRRASGSHSVAGGSISSSSPLSGPYSYPSPSSSSPVTSLSRNELIALEWQRFKNSERLLRAADLAAQQANQSETVQRNLAQLARDLRAIDINSNGNSNNDPNIEYSNNIHPHSQYVRNSSGKPARRGSNVNLNASSTSSNVNPNHVNINLNGVVSDAAVRIAANNVNSRANGSHTPSSPAAAATPSSPFRSVSSKNFPPASPSAAVKRPSTASKRQSSEFIKNSIERPSEKTTTASVANAFPSSLSSGKGPVKVAVAAQRRSESLSTELSSAGTAVETKENIPAANINAYGSNRHSALDEARERLNQRFNRTKNEATVISTSSVNASQEGFISNSVSARTGVTGSNSSTNSSATSTATYSIPSFAFDSRRATLDPSMLQRRRISSSGVVDPSQYREWKQFFYQAKTGQAKSDGIDTNNSAIGNHPTAATIAFQMQAERQQELQQQQRSKENIHPFKATTSNNSKPTSSSKYAKLPSDIPSFTRPPSFTTTSHFVDPIASSSVLASAPSSIPSSSDSSSSNSPNSSARNSKVEGSPHPHLGTSSASVSGKHASPYIPSPNSSSSSSSTAAASASISASASSSSKPLSNVERFLAEERERLAAGRKASAQPYAPSIIGSAAPVTGAAVNNGEETTAAGGVLPPRVAAIPIGRNGGRSLRKKQAIFHAPTDTEIAKEMWKQMKADLENKWGKYEEKIKSSHSPPQNMRRTESQQGVATPAAAATTTVEEEECKEQTSTSDFDQDRSTSTFASAAAPIYPVDASSIPRRATMYSYTNLSREDFRSATNYYMEEKTTSSSSSSTSSKQQPSVFKSRPSSISSSATGTTTNTSNNSYPSSSNVSSSTSSVPPPPASVPSSFYYNLHSLSVSQLKSELIQTYRTSTIGCVEKQDLIIRICECWIKKEEERKKLEEEKKRKEKEIKEEKEKELWREKISRDVSRQVAGKSVKQLLNELNGCESSGNNGYLSRTDGLSAVTKAYRKCCLKIHPDRHVGDWKENMRMTELFQAVNQMYQLYKAKFQ